MSLGVMLGEALAPRAERRCLSSRQRIFRNLDMAQQQESACSAGWHSHQPLATSQTLDLQHQRALPTLRCQELGLPCRC